MAQTDRRFEPLAELGRFAALLGLTGAAIAQPVLAAFGESPETFIFRNAHGADLVRFALVAVLVPPLALWALGVAVGLVWPRGRPLAHGASAGMLVGLAVAQAISSWPAAVVVLVAVALGGVSCLLIVRSGALRLWSQLLAVLPAYSLVAFLVASPASDAFGGGGFEAARTGGSTTPIVLIVLDELPTASLLTSEGTIDAVRFPNLAGFAEDATWYRNATTVAAFTDHAVPAILTGQLPRREAPFSSNYPDNLFRLVAGSHDLVVSEAITRLCPRAVCGDRPRAPASGAAPAEVGADLDGLLGDAVSVWTDGVTGTSRTRLRTDQFQEDVRGAPFEDGSDATLPSDGTDAFAQPTRLTAFVDALEPAERPIAAMLHLVSPHSPWRYLPDGRAYADPADASGLSSVYADDWVASVGRQTHLLQASYADRLVGEVLDELRATDLYEDAVVAVVADHGVSFAPTEMRRGFTDATAPEVLWVPMLVKAPGQAEGGIDESNVETIDLLPTIAAMAGLDIPWEVDGAAAGSDTIEARGDRKTFMRFTNPIVQPEPDRRLEIDGGTGYRRMLEEVFPPVEPGDDAARGLYARSGHEDLMGVPYRPADEARAVLEIDDQGRLLTEDRLVVTLSGALDRGREGTHVVAAAGGRIVAVSPLVTRRDGRRGFELVLPADDPPPLADVRLGLVEADGTIIDSGPV